ncbi:hypothetical protein V492_04429 [Pseudogymnoascus sp. VKM F-4246]|nr:hypothetical protein V492_04429 [Pseudogymnoascus sp. VKM F-4246]
MKYFTALCVAVLAVGANSAAIPEPEPICWLPGQPCGKVKRAAEAFAEAIAEPICWLPGQPCGKAKREANPEAEAICWLPGQPCGKAKRAAEALASAVADANPDATFDHLAIREAFPEPEPAAIGKLTPSLSSSMETSSDMSTAGPVDDKLKREAEAICWLPGQPCGKVKRAAEAISSALAEEHTKRAANAEAEAICWLPGQPCGKAKRNAEALAEAAAVALASMDGQANEIVYWRNDQPTQTTTAPPSKLTPGYCTSFCRAVTTFHAVIRSKRLPVQHSYPHPLSTTCDMLSRSSARSAQGLLRNATSASSSTSAEIRRSFASVQSDIFKPTKYGSKYTVTLIPGDGIGAEITESVKTVFKADNVPIEWEQVDVSGLESGAKHSEELFRESIASLKRNKIGLKGILHTPVDRSGHQSFNVALRQELDIYASVVLIKNIPGYETRHKDVDFAIIRENTEGEYSGLEHQSVPGVVESLKIITRAKSERIAKFAFSFALANNRKKVTCIHKANIMKLADGLFRNTFNAVAKDFPTLESSDMIVDNASMQCVSRPQQFDVMVMPNLYGGILSNVGAALVGGPGIVPGCNMGRDVAVFEPGCRHVGLDIKGKDQANPTAMLLSGAMLLRHLGLDEHANRISKAVYDVIAAGQVRTRDMGGNSTTNEFTRAVLDKM